MPGFFSDFHHLADFQKSSTTSFTNGINLINPCAFSVPDDLSPSLKRSSTEAEGSSEKTTSSSSLFRETRARIFSIESEGPLNSANSDEEPPPVTFKKPAKFSSFPLTLSQIQLSRSGEANGG